MIVEYNNKYKVWTVKTSHTNITIFSHKIKNECYEWIFSKVNYA